jgi:hypothetical protein
VKNIVMKLDQPFRVDIDGLSVVQFTDDRWRIIESKEGKYAPEGSWEHQAEAVDFLIEYIKFISGDMFCPGGCALCS